jgi:NAD(P)-dependent dehydrogenase (short-subunit alcohol dehydrogenase family)
VSKKFLNDWRQRVCKLAQRLKPGPQAQGHGTKSVDPSPRLVYTPQLLAGKTALITGGGRNIGRAIALEMAQQGAHIVVLEKDVVACDRLQPQVEALGVTYRAFAIDITDAAAVTDMVATLKTQQIQIDILVNNVGITPNVIGLNSLAGNHFRDLFEINVFSPLALTYQIVQGMIQANVPGVVLFITSIHQTEIARWIAYSSSKAALKMAVQELALDLSAHGIRVNGIAPGAIAEDEQGHPHPHSYTPLGQSSINPGYIGRAAVYLASDYFSRHTTGTTLTIDGGLSLYHYRAMQHPPS